MNINWKDLGQALFFGLLFYYFLNLTFANPLSVVITCLLFLLPAISLGFYFRRNNSTLVEAGLISFVFGVIIGAVVAFLPEIITQQDVVSIRLQNPIYVTILLAGMYIIIGLFVWFAVNKLKWEKS